MSVQFITDRHAGMVSTIICLFDAFSESLIHWLSLFDAKLLSTDSLIENCCIMLIASALS